MIYLIALLLFSMAGNATRCVAYIDKNEPPMAFISFILGGLSSYWAVKLLTNGGHIN